MDTLNQKSITGDKRIKPERNFFLIGLNIRISKPVISCFNFMLQFHKSAKDVVY